MVFSVNIVYYFLIALAIASRNNSFLVRDFFFFSLKNEYHYPSFKNVVKMLLRSLERNLIVVLLLDMF